MRQPEESLMLNWKTAWAKKAFRNKLMIGFAALLIISICFPPFFQSIEKRDGITLDDFILEYLPARDLSVYIFICIWASIFVALLKSVKRPILFLTILYSYSILCIFRYLSIYFFHLNPPENIVPLIDPFTKFFYGNIYVTKDLFFSGHTATLYLFFLCYEKKWAKFFALFVTVLVGIMLLIQHIHYTIDVAAAPVFSIIALKIAKKIILSR